MKIFTQTKNLIFALLASLIVSISLSGCSDDAPNATSQAVKNDRFDHPHGTEVSNVAKHRFEHDFAEQCVAREVEGSVNKETDRKRFEKPCLCIATYMLKDLTAVEAEKFLVEKKDTQSLQIRFENAAYHCLQQQIQPKAPAVFGKR